jgi:hypothetical protein
MYVISANRLSDGAVVYLGPRGSWAKSLAAGKVFPAKAEADAALAGAQADASRNLIVEPCLVEVRMDAAGLRPLTLREWIRAQGPTIDFLPGPAKARHGQHGHESSQRELRTGSYA